MECALLLEDALNAGEKRQLTKTKFKFDWQIVVIAASHVLPLSILMTAILPDMENAHTFM